MKSNFVFPAVVVALIGAGFAANAQSTPQQPAEEAPVSAISFEQAVEIANSNGAGNIIAMELADDEFDTAAYVVEMESDTSFTELVIDGVSGEILMTATITAASPELFTEMTWDDELSAYEFGDDCDDGHEDSATHEDHG